MKKLFLVILTICLCLLSSGYTYEETSEDSETSSFDINNLYDYQKEYKTEELELCASNSSKTYMDYRAITARNSKQYQFIHNNLTVDETTGFLYDEDGFIGVALGSYFGEIGDRFYFTLDSGIVLPLVKCESKADKDTDGSGCYHPRDNSVIEFVIDKDVALEYFGRLSNSYILNGNFNNYSLFNGEIVKIEKVLDEKNDTYVTYQKRNNISINTDDIFYYASGY